MLRRKLQAECVLESTVGLQIYFHLSFQIFKSFFSHLQVFVAQTAQVIVITLTSIIAALVKMEVSNHNFYTKYALYSHIEIGKLVTQYDRARLMTVPYSECKPNSYRHYTGLPFLLTVQEHSQLFYHYSSSPQRGKIYPLGLRLHHLIKRKYVFENPKCIVKCLW